MEGGVRRRCRKDLLRLTSATTARTHVHTAHARAAASAQGLKGSTGCPSLEQGPAAAGPLHHPDNPRRVQLRCRRRSAGLRHRRHCPTCYLIAFKITYSGDGDTHAPCTPFPPFFTFRRLLVPKGCQQKKPAAAGPWHPGCRHFMSVGMHTRTCMHIAGTYMFPCRSPPFSSSAAALGNKLHALSCTPRALARWAPRAAPPCWLPLPPCTRVSLPLLGPATEGGGWSWLRHSARQLLCNTHDSTPDTRRRHQGRSYVRIRAQAMLHWAGQPCQDCGSAAHSRLLQAFAGLKHTRKPETTAGQVQ
mgnify:CR=1 FL=1